MLERVAELPLKFLFEVFLELVIEVLFELLRKVLGEFLGVKVEFERLRERRRPLIEMRVIESRRLGWLRRRRGQRLRRLWRLWCLRRQPFAAAAPFFFAARNRLAREIDVAAERLQLDPRAAAAEREVESLAAAARVLAFRQLHREVGPEIALERADEDGGIVGAAKADADVAVVRAEPIRAV